MLSILKKYGLYASLIILILYVLSTLIGQQTDHGVWEILGYITIFAGLSMVYFGLQAYRQSLPGGQMRFGQGVRFGLLLTVIVALAFSLVDLAYVTLVDPDFYDKYLTVQLDELRQELPAEEFAVRSEEMREEIALFSHPAASFLLMFVTVFVIGTIITLLSSLVLYDRSA